MPRLGEPITLDQYFAEHNPRSRELFEVVREAVEEIGPADVRATKSQVAFRRRIGFAWVWMPAQYLRGERPPVVLTVDLHRRDPSPRWKEAVEVRPGRFTHHLELHSAEEIDGEVRAWLREAWEEAA